MKIKFYWEDRNLIDEIESKYVPEKHFVYQDLWLEIEEKVLVVKDNEQYIVMVCAATNIDSDEDFWEFLGFGKEESTS